MNRKKKLGYYQFGGTMIPFGYQALETGFRYIPTANGSRHPHQDQWRLSFTTGLANSSASRSQADFGAGTVIPFGYQAHGTSPTTSWRWPKNKESVRRPHVCIFHGPP